MGFRRISAVKYPSEAVLTVLSAHLWLFLSRYMAAKGHEDSSGNVPPTFNLALVCVFDCIFTRTFIASRCSFTLFFGASNSSHVCSSCCFDIPNIAATVPYFPRCHPPQLRRNSHYHQVCFQHLVPPENLCAPEASTCGSRCTG